MAENFDNSALSTESKIACLADSFVRERKSPKAKPKIAWLRVKLHSIFHVWGTQLCCNFCNKA